MNWFFWRKKKPESALDTKASCDAMSRLFASESGRAAPEIHAAMMRPNPWLTMTGMKPDASTEQYRPTILDRFKGFSRDWAGRIKNVWVSLKGHDMEDLDE